MSTSKGIIFAANPFIFLGSCESPAWVAVLIVLGRDILNNALINGSLTVKDLPSVYGKFKT